ncbi:hypothetical protein HPB51_006490 [Rhipicephalus microplus]|uniref:Uncharacterized protein n=1 Tax=Rhipicephalus microplus TaxID=6941 RepID=A0A9J6E724_RHIMP|nr:hypothetical protein HPB51_006490 [Rhipicephalus microplus]
MSVGRNGQTKKTDKHIADVRKQLDEQVDEKREKIQKKLDTAQENRAAIYRELQMKLQEKVCSGGGNSAPLL